MIALDLHRFPAVCTSEAQMGQPPVYMSGLATDIQCVIDLHLAAKRSNSRQPLINRASHIYSYNPEFKMYLGMIGGEIHTI